MPFTLSQANRLLTTSTPLGEDVLVAVALTGEESVSRPFLFTVDFVSTKPSISAAGLLGKPMTLHLPHAGGARPVHGLVRRFSSMGQTRELHRYRAEIVPALWFLTLSSDCRTFENMSRLDIVKKVCKDAGIADVEPRVAVPPPPVPYVVQYRETNFDFVSRLLEEAGIYYFFEHTEKKHTLIMSDAHAGAISAGAVASLAVDMVSPDGRPKPDVVFELERDFAVNSASVKLTDHDLLRPDSTGSASSSSPGARGEYFDFLGDLGPNRSEPEAKQWIETDEGERDVIRGSSTCATLQAGTRVKISGGVIGSDGVDFHLLRVSHRLTTGDVLAGTGLSAEYQNDFTAIPAATQYRPERVTPKPSVRGTQTAVVVGPGDKGDVHVDKDGRILVQFPWDRGAGANGKSDHWVHVTTRWAGTNWGIIHIPRIGQEVIVDFLEGDPDRPIVIGSVYDSTHAPPYALPANKTQSGIKSQSVPGGGGFNELRFEDKKGEEHVFLHAQKDLNVNVENDETRAVLHDRVTTIKHADTRTVQEGDDKHTVSKGNQTVAVTEGNQTVTVSKGNQTVEVSKGDQTVTVAQGKQTVTVQGDQSVTIKQGGRTVTLQQGNDTLAIKMGNLSIEAGMGNISMAAKAGKISIEAIQGIDLKVGPNEIQLGPAGITIKGVTVSAEATAQTQVKGAMVTVQADAMMQVKGPMTQINGDGMLMLKGGVTMIN